MLLVSHNLGNRQLLEDGAGLARRRLCAVCSLSAG